MAIKLSNSKANKPKRVWPKGYNRFDSGNEEEFVVKPQKYNLKLILLSLAILLILWFFVARPYLSQISQKPKKEDSIKIKLFKGNIPSQSSPKPK